MKERGRHRNNRVCTRADHFGCCRLIRQGSVVPRLHRAWGTCMLTMLTAQRKGTFAWHALLHGMNFCMVCTTAWYALLHGMNLCMVCIFAWHALLHGMHAGDLYSTLQVVESLEATCKKRALIQNSFLLWRTLQISMRRTTLKLQSSVRRICTATLQPCRT
eukprot:scaffold275892_cov31-Tisochrysis_lutea.AAC.1